MSAKAFLVFPLMAAIFWLSNCQQQPSDKPTTAQANLSREAQVQRGEYLAGFAMCDDCHTPKIMTEHGPQFDMSRRFSGHPAGEPFDTTGMKDLVTTRFVAVFSSGLTAYLGPWGVSYAANLTPDDTGIGNWTEAQFIKAIREGKSKGMDGARPLLPPMPWEVVRNMSDEDLKALFAYFKSVKPIQNVVPNPKSL
ncbi:MAG: diheme cytochrome c-553 [Saprospiraceae bacterium]|nr:diheme cytochrome c-553 [Saprospiraceae bacterium]